MSEAERQGDPTQAGDGTTPGMPDPARLRRRPFGYKRSDVDEALQTRDAQLAELRQDIAALWLAFAQHDRMIRDLGGSPAPAERPREEGAGAPASPEGGQADESVGRQLSELDEVLSAIELATQTLERTYSEDAEPKPASGTEATASESAPEQGGRSASA